MFVSCSFFPTRVKSDGDIDVMEFTSRLQWQTAHKQLAAVGLALIGWPVDVPFPLTAHEDANARLNVPGRTGPHCSTGLRAFDTDEVRAIVDAFRHGKIGLVRRARDGTFICLRCRFA